MTLVDAAYENHDGDEGCEAKKYTECYGDRTVSVGVVYGGIAGEDRV